MRKYLELQLKLEKEKKIHKINDDILTTFYILEADTSFLLLLLPRGILPAVLIDNTALLPPSGADLPHLPFSSPATL